MKPTKSDQIIHKYSIKIEPEVAVKGKLIGEIIKACKEQLEDKFGFANRKFYSNLYSFKMVSDEVAAKATVDGQDYVLKVNFSKVLEESDIEFYSYQKNLFNDFMRLIEFEKIGRSCFNPKAAK